MCPQQRSPEPREVQEVSGRVGWGLHPGTALGSGTANTSKRIGGHRSALGTAPLTDAEQLLVLLGSCSLKTLQEPSGDMEDVISVREESFQVKIRQLKGTEMPQVKPKISDRGGPCVLEALMSFRLPHATLEELE